MARPALPIQRDQVVRLALDIADREGLEAASFRRLADELGVTPMALYHHVRDKADLLAAMADLLLSEVEVPPHVPPWSDELRTLLGSFVAARDRHSCAVALLHHESAATSLAGLRLAEAALDILRRAGFDAADGVRIVQQLGALLTSHAPIGCPCAQDDRAQAQEAWAHLPADTFPRLRESAAHAGAWNDAERDRVFGVELLVLGVQKLLEQPERIGVLLSSSS